MKTCESSAQLDLLPMESPSMSSQAGSHAKISASPALAADLTVNAQVCGAKSHASLARYDHASFSWKTWQHSFLEEWVTFSETWPASGMTRNGQLYPRAPWVRHTCDSECSLWPTPTASMDGRGFGIPMHEKAGRYRQSIVSRVQELVGAHGWRIHPNFTETLMGYPLDWSAIEP
jgi:hypothetical protein